MNAEHSRQMEMSSAAPSNSVDGFDSSTGRLRPILKKNAKTVHRLMISIAYVRDADGVFFRTHEMDKSYAMLQRRIADVAENEDLEQVDFYHAGHYMLYLLRQLLPEERYHRAVVIDELANMETGERTVVVELMDTGEQAQLIEGMHELYALPAELYHYTDATVAGPCRLMTEWDFNSSAGELDALLQLKNVTTLRSLLPVGELFFAEITEVPSYNFGSFERMGGYASDFRSQQAPREEARFYVPGSSDTVNNVYQRLVQCTRRAHQQQSGAPSFHNSQRFGNSGVFPRSDRGAMQQQFGSSSAFHYSGRGGDMQQQFGHSGPFHQSGRGGATQQVRFQHTNDVVRYGPSNPTDFRGDVAQPEEDVSMETDNRSSTKDLGSSWNTATAGGELFKEKRDE